MKRLLALLLSATMVLGFTGCGASGDTAKSDTKVPEVTLGTTSWPTNMFFYLANEKGFFEKEGVKVKIQVDRLIFVHLLHQKLLHHIFRVEILQ